MHLIYFDVHTHNPLYTVPETLVYCTNYLSIKYLMARLVIRYVKIPITSAICL